MFEVGTSVNIWGSAARVTVATLNRARGYAHGTPVRRRRTRVRAMQTSFRDQFAWAETNNAVSLSAIDWAAGGCKRHPSKASCTELTGNS